MRARGVRPEAGRCCPLGPRGPCSAQPVTVGHSIIGPLALRCDVGGRADPQALELRTALLCTETQPGTLRGTHRSPGSHRHSQGDGRGFGEQPSVPTFPRRDARCGTPSLSREAGTGQGDSYLLRAGPAQWVQEGGGPSTWAPWCWTSEQSPNIQIGAGGPALERPAPRPGTAAQKPGLQGALGLCPPPGPSLPGGRLHTCTRHRPGQVPGPVGGQRRGLGEHTRPTNCGGAGGGEAAMRKAPPWPGSRGEGLAGAQRAGEEVS